ncbi:hypothetical protein [Thalassobacillus sp. CUG 92003]|uniref:hypothetical protein n=1 Tax=Thalassobacillus sp. CUG 92003 TaxID=2736641 RepID=UPI0015E773F5|nr:hypothetical protein [Thalassobacillus sp. CUG 92003]
MSVFGWVAVVILLVVVTGAAYALFAKTPSSKGSKHALANTPLLAGVVFVLFLPENLLADEESVGTFLKTVVPFFCVLVSLPLFLKVIRETKKSTSSGR